MTLLVLADDDTEEEKLAVFADRVDERSRAVAPGKGHVDPGHRAKLGDALTFLNHGLLDSSIVDDARCMNARRAQRALALHPFNFNACFERSYFV